MKLLTPNKQRKVPLATEMLVPGYLAKRMKMYRKEQEEERRAEAELHQQRMTEMGAWQ